ncbi:MAG: DUF4293 domain-containing protein [Firmicutes bacterium]|nr:DUF4293 domain-containing protein [Bacillota bacterium]MCM1400513.1 DUF4293 domain-containing protein [Bacteroides sp.]MCM1476859.1 DUF4293 domain-containing protein [Bacteroides sp.]
MIQRIQTLFLLLGIGLAIAFLFVPFGYAPTVDLETGASVFQPFKGVCFTGLLVPTVVSVVLMLVAIFMFKNYAVQKLLTILSAISLLATIGVVIYAVVSPYVDTNPDVTVATVWGGGGLFLVAALIAVFAAYHYICRDQRLIRSYDRIR